MSILSDSYTPRKLLRDPIKDISQHDHQFSDAVISDALRMLFRDGDLAIVQDAIIDRFAYGVKEVSNPVSGTATQELDTQKVLNKAVELAIINGQQEILTLSTFPMLVSEMATLFTEQGLSYSYDDETTGEEMIALREESGSDLALPRWDTLACATGSACLYCSVENGQLVEEEVPVNAIYIAFADEITEDGGSRRPTNMTNIDEASLVVMQMATTSSDTKRFGAWYGPCEAYPDGRNVVYMANAWYEIPDVGDDTALDYTTSGEFKAGAGAEEIANPLSLHASKENDYSLPTYPFAILYSDPTTPGLMPVSTSLYESVVELEIMASVLFGQAGTSARGAQVLKEDVTGGSKTIPANTREGLIIPGRGMDLSFQGWAAVNTKDAYEVYEKVMASIAQANHVPTFYVLPQQGGEVPSGVALEMMYEPSRRYRDKRVRTNRDSVRRRFNLERALVNSVTGKESISSNVTEAWEPGGREFPVDPNTDADAWIKRIDKGVNDLADWVQDFYDLETIEQAYNLLEDKQTLKTENAASLPQPPQDTAPDLTGGGLRDRLQAKRGNK